MSETLSSGSISTKLARIAELVRKYPHQPLSSLHQCIDAEWLREAYRRTRKNAAAGVDGQTAEDYAQDLEGNLANLLDRFRSGAYRAPAVRRVHIAKGDGRTRPIGIPTFEDKVLQRAVAMVLEAVYEPEFHSGSYGFRPGRSAHDALEALWQGGMSIGGGWMLEVDIQSFFDTLDHGVLRRFLDERVIDGVLRRAIDKWLKAGVLEGGEVTHPEEGTPQGGVISPILANIYLHGVLDQWFESEVKPRLRGRAFLIRYADDFVVGFDREEDARKVMDVLPKRFGRFGLTLHPTKTRLVKFTRPRPGRDGDDRPGSFDFLGFRHHWGTSRRGKGVIKRRTSPSRFSRALRRVREWCRDNRHRPIAEQRKELERKLRGHYGYYGITGNFDALSRFLLEVRSAWRYWLARRSQRAPMAWDRFEKLNARYPLPKPSIVHSALA
ncbi:MAG: group II intron reverse transcriptase/maturase [Sandaracinus sp.]|nr:group II intron reverse transcriptase/maturase [Sandaracinus sp.]